MQKELSTLFIASSKVPGVLLTEPDVVVQRTHRHEVVRGWPLPIFRSRARSWLVARRAILGSISELVVIVRQLVHQCSDFKVFHPGG